MTTNNQYDTILSEEAKRPYTLEKVEVEEEKDMRRKKVTRRIISKRQWETLVEKGIIKYAGSEYFISLVNEVKNNFTLKTVGQIEEVDFQLASIPCTKEMYRTYIKEEPHDVEVVDDYNPCEYEFGFYVPEWMFEDRQDDLVDMYKRYGKYKEE